MLDTDGGENSWFKIMNNPGCGLQFSAHDSAHSSAQGPVIIDQPTPGHRSSGQFQIKLLITIETKSCSQQPQTGPHLKMISVTNLTVTLGTVA